MDQKKVFIPRERRLSKENSKLTKLRAHMVGGIFHSGLADHGKEVYCGFDLFEWPHDPNMTANMFLTMLGLWVKDHYLPSVWYVQLDNCTRENKNNVLFGFFAMLVQKGIFSKVSKMVTMWVEKFADRFQNRCSSQYHDPCVQIPRVALCLIKLCHQPKWRRAPRVFWEFSPSTWGIEIHTLWKVRYSACVSWMRVPYLKSMLFFFCFLKLDYHWTRLLSK